MRRFILGHRLGILRGEEGVVPAVRDEAFISRKLDAAQRQAVEVELDRAVDAIALATVAVLHSEEAVCAVIRTRVGRRLREGSI